jgi:glycosyltransferase involved in cell wall biosynthesis
MTADAVGGVWRYSLDLASALQERGIDVTVAVMGPFPDKAQLADAARRRIPIVQAPFALEWMTDPWNEVARAGEWLLHVEQSVRPDLVHLNGYSHAALPWRTPVLVVAHSCVRSWWRAVHGSAAPAEWDQYTDAVRVGLRSADLVVAPTVAMLAALEDEYGTIDHTTVIPNGRNAPPLPPYDKADVVLTAGRIWDEAKNIQALCDVAPSVPWRVCVAGDARGPDGGERCTRNVEVLGKLASEALGAWYARAAIYALPAKYEPFGLSVLEAAGAGCALVLGDIPSLRENWEGAALFVAPDDRTSLAHALSSLIDDPAQRTALAERARTRAGDFTISRMADAYVTAYAAASIASGSAAGLLHA